MLKRTGKEGQSLVEVALAMPLLILIMMGILDIGRMYFTFVTISDAAAEGAIYAARHPTEEAQIIARAVESCDSDGLGLVSLDPELVYVNYGDVDWGNPVTVTVEYEYKLLTPLLSDLGRVATGEDTVTLRAEVVQSILQ